MIARFDQSTNRPIDDFYDFNDCSDSSVSPCLKIGSSPTFRPVQTEPCLKCNSFIDFARQVRLKAESFSPLTLGLLLLHGGGPWEQGQCIPPRAGLGNILALKSHARGSNPITLYSFSAVRITTKGGLTFLPLFLENERRLMPLKC